MDIDERLEESIENKYMQDDKGKNKMKLTAEESLYILKRRDFNSYVEEKAIQTVLEELEKKDNTIALLKVLNKELKNDFEKFKKDKDINYLDNNHHKVLVENSLGQTIDKPQDCWFDAVEVKIIRNNILYGVNIDKDFITLKEISDEHPEECVTVIAESPLSGAIYRYNNYGKKEWQLIGNMIGYA